MKNVVVIGSNGQLGNDIVKVFSEDSFFNVVGLTHREIDVTDMEQLEAVLKQISPNIVINTASFHKLEDVEKDIQKGFNVNTFGQRNLSLLSSMNDWTNVFISTDYVFGLDDKRSKPYKEKDITAPINIYGITKVAAENFTQYISPKHFIVRVSGLFGMKGPSGKGKNFIEQMIDLSKEKKDVFVVNDQVCSPTHTKSVAKNLIMLLKTDKYGIYHMTSQGKCSWWQFAKEIFSILDKDINCRKVNSNYFPSNAMRPKYSVLENSNLKRLGIDIMPNWRVSLKEYLKDKNYL